METRPLCVSARSHFALRLQGFPDPTKVLQTGSNTPLTCPVSAFPGLGVTVAVLTFTVKVHTMRRQMLTVTIGGYFELLPG